MWLDTDNQEAAVKAPQNQGPEDGDEHLTASEPEEAPEGEKKPAGKAPAADGAKSKKAGSDTERRLKQLEAELQQARESERYWAELAKKAAAGGRASDDEEETEAEPEEPEEPVEQFLDELSSQGLKALRKRGLLTVNEAKQMIAEVLEAERAKLMADAELARNYPELMDESSPLFAKAREIYRDMVKKDPALKNSPVALETAARLARAELGGSAENGKSGRRAGAAFERGSGGRSGAVDDGGRLSERQKQILARFNQAGFKVGEEEYRRRAAEGVNMSTRAFYRPGTFQWTED
jgi:hypothetical protein